MAPIEEWFEFLDLEWKITTTSSGKEILTRSGSPKGQKTPKNGLSATFLKHRKKSWENEYLER